MKRGALLEFQEENIEKSKFYLNILRCFSGNVCVPCNAFPKMGTLNLKMSPNIY